MTIFLRCLFCAAVEMTGEWKDGQTVRHQTSDAAEPSCGGRHSERSARPSQ
jgi:hypothetical protein